MFLIFSQSCVRMRMSKVETKSFFENNKTVFNDSTIHFRDFDIHFLQTGQKSLPTLYFIHGSPGSWDAFKTYLNDADLLQKYRMIAIDRPGFGFSNFGEAQNLEVQAERIKMFIDKMDNQKPIALIGHSLGGPLVARLGSDYPNLAQNIVILAGAVDPKAETPEKWRPVLMSKPLRYLIPGALRPSNDELWWLKDDLILMKPLLKNITAQVVIIHGTKDSLVPFSNLKFMVLAFENAKKIDTIPIENADHFIPWSHFEIVKKALLGLRFNPGTPSK